jgi:KUP system potassium uptake protein
MRFWTLTLQTTIKYVLITLSADNHGEGDFRSMLWSRKKIMVDCPSNYWRKCLTG